MKKLEQLISSSIISFLPSWAGLFLFPFSLLKWSHALHVTQFPLPPQGPNFEAHLPFFPFLFTFPFPSCVGLEQPAHCFFALPWPISSTVLLALSDRVLCTWSAEDPPLPHICSRDSCSSSSYSPSSIQIKRLAPSLSPFIHLHQFIIESPSVWV